YSAIASSGLRIVSINLDEPANPQAVRAFVTKAGLPFPILLGTQEVAGIYNIIYRYLFDRRRDLGVPTSFLLDENNMIIKVYQGTIHPTRFVEDLKTVPRTPADRLQKALPYAGTLYQGSFQRTAFTYGVALFQRGYLE